MRRDATPPLQGVRRTIAAEGTTTLRLRLRDAHDGVPFERFDAKLQDARDAADAFYAKLQSAVADPEARRVQRQAFAGMICSAL